MLRPLHVLPGNRGKCSDSKQTVLKVGGTLQDSSYQMIMWRHIPPGQLPDGIKWISWHVILFMGSYLGLHWEDLLIHLYEDRFLKIGEILQQKFEKY